MRSATICVLLLAASGAPMHAAVAQDKPLLAPSRDVAVTYRVNGASRTSGAAVIKLTYADQDQKVRLDLFAFAGATTPFGSLIYDQPDNRVLSLDGGHNAYYVLPATGRVNPGLMLGASMQYKQQGTATIAGLQCTDWQVWNGTEDIGSACVTSDGVVLRGNHVKPAPSGLEAIAVVYGTPPPGVFQPDPGMILRPNGPASPALPARPHQ